jgi:hypothetical protein
MFLELHNMICANGKQQAQDGERGIFFICYKGDYKGNQCRFVRWCGREQQYIMLNKDCPDYSDVMELKETPKQTVANVDEVISSVGSVSFVEDAEEENDYFKPKSKKKQK